MEKTKKLKVPHVYIILLTIIAVCAVLSYIIPAGQYEMVEGPENRMIVDPDSFGYVDSNPQGLFAFLKAVPKGMVESADIIFFILIVGGAFGVIESTGAIEAGIGKITKVFGKRPAFVIPIVMFAFSMCGAVFGMAEETLPFIPIMVILAIALGYDSVTGAAMVLAGAGAGFAGAFMNPFTVGVGQGIAELPMLSGLTFRIVLYIMITTLTIVFIMYYASRIKKNPELSCMYEVDLAREDKLDLDNIKELTTQRVLILLVLLGTVVLLIFGVIEYGWYITEISGLFLGAAMVVAIVAGLGFNGFALALLNGMAALTGGALVVGFARGILVVLTEGLIIHTILHSAAETLSVLPTAVSALGMYVFQCLLNFIVPSGSGQAAVSLPILVPLGDLLGITRQTAVVAFQLGDGISNIFTPTSGYFMAGLALAKIPWNKWARWILPLILMQYALGAVFVVVAQLIQLGPF